MRVLHLPYHTPQHASHADQMQTVFVQVLYRMHVLHTNSEPQQQLYKNLTTMMPVRRPASMTAFSMALVTPSSHAPLPSRHRQTRTPDRLRPRRPLARPSSGCTPPRLTPHARLPDLCFRRLQVVTRGTGGPPPSDGRSWAAMGSGHGESPARACRSFPRTLARGLGESVCVRAWRHPIGRALLCFLFLTQYFCFASQQGGGDWDKEPWAWPTTQGLGSGGHGKYLRSRPAAQ